ncbi:hypothetical protein cand_030030 [Cryptosporidium andersoni]|uniref:Uncharacterized protein n=1 Tax=Cryptosporidium andersoni TaxID=117008 RepID=A0A1J4MNI3_9CRYT|nr:hypothetical protein cand_030030 [Cryptosporidium andersoni]
MMNEEDDNIYNLLTEYREKLKNNFLSIYLWNVDFILMNEVSIPCRLLITQKECGFLSNEFHSQGINEVNSGEILSLPLWLAKDLYSRGFIDINYPDFLSPKMMNALKTDPCSIDLAQISPYFFEVGIELSKIFKDEIFLKVLLEAFKTRLEQLYLFTQCSNHCSINQVTLFRGNTDYMGIFLNTLTSCEKGILEECLFYQEDIDCRFYCVRKAM